CAVLLPRVRVRANRRGLDSSAYDGLTAGAAPGTAAARRTHHMSRNVESVIDAPTAPYVVRKPTAAIALPVSTAPSGVPARVIERNGATTFGRISAGARVVISALIGATPSGPPSPNTNMTTSASGNGVAIVSSQIGADIRPKPAMPRRSGLYRRAKRNAAN